MKFLKGMRIYSIVTGTILFIIGIFGFAFRGQSALPDSYLVLAILFGFWGILVGIKGDR